MLFSIGSSIQWDSFKEKMDSLYNMGLKFGMIFQIKDDILDYSSSDITGKIMGNDLKESKINFHCY